MKICKVCNYKDDGDAKFCSKCGSPLSDANSTEDNKIDIENIIKNIDIIYCSKCGVINKLKSIFCTECGATLEDEIQEMETKKRVKKIRFPLLIIGSIIFLLLIIAFLFLSQKETVVLNNSNITEYADINIEIVDYVCGKPVTVPVWGICNYSSSTATIKITVTPKGKYIFQNAVLEYNFVSYLWYIEDFSHISLALSKEGNCTVTKDISSVDLQLIPASKPSNKDILLDNISGSVKYFKYFR